MTLNMLVVGKGNIERNGKRDATIDDLSAPMAVLNPFASRRN